MKSYDEIREIKWSYFIVDVLAEFDGNNFYIAVEWRRNDPATAMHRRSWA